MKEIFQYSRGMIKIKEMSNNWLKYDKFILYNVVSPQRNKLVKKYWSIKKKKIWWTPPVMVIANAEDVYWKLKNLLCQNNGR